MSSTRARRDRRALMRLLVDAAAAALGPTEQPRHPLVARPGDARDDRCGPNVVVSTHPPHRTVDKTPDVAATHVPHRSPYLQTPTLAQR